MEKIQTLIIALAIIAGCQGKKSASTSDMLDRENLIAWCIVPFDAEKRLPEERADMLNELGIPRLAYDYRDEHLPSFGQEIAVLAGHGIGLRAVWFWVQGHGNDLLDSTNLYILDVLENTGTRTELWVSFPDDYFKGTPDDENLAAAVHAVREIRQKAEASGCSVALYNHGGWFGEPGNLVKIVQKEGSGKIRIVYNFHHAHHRIDQFKDDLSLMLPYLSAINLNGMREEGPKIITLGQGSREAEMIRIILESGYDGPFGIIGHTEGEDVRAVLERNLQGLERLKEQL